MAGYGGKGGSYGAAPNYGAGKAGGSYPLSLMGGNGVPMGQSQPYGQMGNAAVMPYGLGGQMGNAIPLYSPNSMAPGGGGDIAVIVQTTTIAIYNPSGNYNLGGKGAASTGSMYKPDNRMKGDSLDSILGGKYNSQAYNQGMKGNGSLIGGPGINGYDPLKHQMPYLKDFGEANYNMGDQNYSRTMLPKGKNESLNESGSAGGIMGQAPKARYDELSKRAKANQPDNYAGSNVSRALPTRDGKRQREPSELERVAMELPVNSYQSFQPSV